MKVVEIFNSVMGEVNPLGQGAFATFIRLGTCNLSCRYCDTDFSNYTDLSVKEVIKSVEMNGCKNVLITGGEPLLQMDELVELSHELRYKKYYVMCETNGTIPIDGALWPIKSFIVDYKLPGSGMLEEPKDEIFIGLDMYDYIKFVIETWEDYAIAKNKVKEWRSRDKDSGETVTAQIAFSPVHDFIPARVLMATMQEDKLFDIILNVQIHKYILVR